MSAPIRIRNAREHNLRGVDVDIPRGCLTVVTGVSGSGKSSLVFDTLHATGQRRYLETLSARARQFVERLPQPAVDAVAGLSPTLALGQRTGSSNPRSTVGTMSGAWDLLRLLFARLGRRVDGAPVEDRGPWLFSFNTHRGACARCKGLGVEDRVDPALLVADAGRTLREGALVPTLPNGYIVYSQVTVDVLDQVCRAHGFDVDTAWERLTAEQRHVVFFGSDRLEVPFGKHALESRMKWSGITARPRELGHYKGLVPTITETLQRNRNANVLRFVRSHGCAACGGSRLNDDARALLVDGESIADVGRLPLRDLSAWVTRHEWPPELAPVGQALRRRTAAMAALGLGHLTCDRATPTLSGGEAQRVRLAATATAGLAGVTFVFDEPSIGLHAAEEGAVLDAVQGLRDAGNTVVVVEHSAAALRAADHVIDIGPGAGVHGGELLFAGEPDRLDAADPRSATRLWHGVGAPAMPCCPEPAGAARLVVRGARATNLRDIDVEFRLGTLNVVCGVAGAGKSSLVDLTLSRALRAALHGARDVPGEHTAIVGGEPVRKVVHVDQAPIGRTPRSNAATYTGLFDEVRALFAAAPVSRERGFGRNHFSLNVRGGRCEACQGSGREVVGMHGLPDVEVVCRGCRGRRFGDDVLAVRWNGRTVLDVLEATVEDAREWFAAVPRVARPLLALHDLGLDYLTLGQPATTLSGGEAQRIKLAAELARPATGHTLYVLDEPTVGLHRADVALLLRALVGLVAKGHTAVVVEHDLDVVAAAGHVVELGPGAGRAGGQVVFSGAPAALAAADTATGRALVGRASPVEAAVGRRRSGAPSAAAAAPIRLRGVSTHNLQGVDVDLSADALTVVTGVSGSGKSSLVFDTLHRESRARITEHLSAHARRQLGAGAAERATLAAAEGLRPTVALAQRDGVGSRRSTVATMAGVHPLLRILWSRAGVDAAGAATTLPAAAFSFLRHEGACPACEGLGAIVRCDVDRLVAAPDRPLFAGGLGATRTGRFYGDPQGKHCAIVTAVAARLGFDVQLPWDQLDDAARQAVLHGCGAREFDVVWRFARGRRQGEHAFTATWPGFCGEIDAEYARKRGDARGAAMEEEVLSAQTCAACAGERLGEGARQVRFAGVRLGQLCARAVDEVVPWLDRIAAPDARAAAVLDAVRPELRSRLERLQRLGLGHLALQRSADTLSGGEAQRVRIARQLAAPLQGVVYVLDEPTVGLHPRDTRGLLEVLRELVALGNGVVCVEHDLDVVRAADHVIEVGPGAGSQGGRIVAAAAPGDLPAGCRTTRALARDRGRPLRSPRPAGPGLCIENATLHNLRGLDVRLPTANLVAVTGVSGSGKTSLVSGVLAASVVAGRPVGCSRIEGLAAFRQVVDVAASMRAGSPASCIATTTGVLDELRRRFAATDAAKAGGWKAAAFAYAGKVGGCAVCGGIGRVRSDLDFLGSVWSVCDSCGGRRYRGEVLKVRWRARCIADYLAMRVDEAAALLADVPKIRDALGGLTDLGLGYLTLGQGADTFSGGEAQRLFLAGQLGRVAAAPLLFLLDEPTRGLHPDDVDALLVVLDRLVDAGHTVITVEHDVAVIAHADHVVDLGPGSGAQGGRVVFSGPPQGLRDAAGSATGAFLSPSAR